MKITKKNHSIWKEIVAPLCLFLLVTGFVLMVKYPAFAQTPSSAITNIGEQTNLPSYETTGHGLSSYEPGASNITSAIYYAIDLLKYAMGSVAIFVIILSGIRLITGARKIEEVAKTEKEHLKYAIIGLVVIVVADQFVKNVFFGQQGEIYSSKTTLQLAAQAGTEQIKSIYNLMEYFAAAIAILMIIISGFQYVTSGGKEETQTKARQHITYAIIGLLVLGIAEFSVKDLIFPQQGSQLSDIDKLKKLIISFTNFVSGFVSILAAAMYIYGGYLYVTAMGKEETTNKAKKVLIGATIGLLLALGAFAIVTTTVTLQPTVNTTPAGTTAPANLPTSGNIAQ